MVDFIDKGDVFNLNGIRGCAHGCNCAGAMGKGIVLQFREQLAQSAGVDLIALPAIGLGGLSWDLVRALIEDIAPNYSKVDFCRQKLLFRIKLDRISR